MSTIYFQVVAKDFDFDLLLTGGYVAKWLKTFSKAFDKFFCNNKNQIMIIKLFKGEFLQKQFRKEWIFIS